MSLMLAVFIIAIVLMLATGFYGLLATHNLIRILISLEVLVKAATLLLIVAGYMADKIALAQTFAITLIIIEVMLLVVAAGIVLNVYRHNNTLDTRKLSNLKG